MRLTNRMLLENSFPPDGLERPIKALVERYNHQRYHESPDNIPPADAYSGRATATIT